MTTLLEWLLFVADASRVGGDFVVVDMRKWTRTVIVMVSAGLLATGVGYGTAMADGYGHGSGSIKGDGYSNGTFKFHAHNDSRDPFDATGYFTSDSPFGPTLNHLEGRITCLVVDGNRAGFVYQVDRGSPPLVFDHREAKVSIEDNGHGGADKIEFSFTMPAGTFKDCNPGQATHQVSRGYVTVREGDD